MSFKELHINGKYALLAALVAAVGVVSAAAIHVYKPFSTSKDHKKLYVTKNEQNLYSANYVIDDGITLNIFQDLKQESFSINPKGKKIFYVKKSSMGTDELVKNTIKIVNHDTSHSNEIELFSYVQYEAGMPEVRHCQVSIKGWEKPNAIILNINECSGGSFEFTVGGGYSLYESPKIKTVNGHFDINNNGDYIINFDEFNKVSSVLILKS